MSNIDIARSAHQAFSHGDLAAVKDAYAQHCVWYSSDEVKPGGELHGRDAIMEMMTHLPDYWTTVSIEPSTFLEADDYVIVLGTQRFANANGSAESPFVNVLKFGSDGKVIRSEFHADSAKMAKLQA